jgi:glyoxylase-like metal-dependent hydrolase (beta-lactamase superfamily II)
MWKLNVKIIKTGSISFDPGNIASSMYSNLKYRMGVGGGSTVSLIKEQDELLLIDTGFEFESDFTQHNKDINWEKLKLFFKMNDIKPDDISKIFITHFHRDHFGNIEYFKNAKWYCYKQPLLNFKNSIIHRFITVKEGDSIVPNTKVIYTPGHTISHSSLLWEDENKSIKIAICGDAIINLAWLQSGYIWKFNSDFYDEESVKKSVRHLLDIADIIIPGHGEPFFSSTISVKR